MPKKPRIDLNDTGNRIIAAIVLGMIFLGGWWFIARNAYNGSVSLSGVGDVKDAASGGTTSESGVVRSTSVFGPLSEETPMIAGSKESIDVTDQSAGMTVKIRSVTLAQMGWIAVRDVDGRTLGAGRFDPPAGGGMLRDIEVPLLRATVAGERYQVLIYVDDGDREFDLHKDILVTGSDGSVAGDVFTAQ